MCRCLSGGRPIDLLSRRSPRFMARTSRCIQIPLLIVLLGALGGLGLSGCSTGDTPGALCYPSDQPGVACEPYPVLTQDDLPECQKRLTSADVSCAMKLFAPLAGPPWPFDAGLVAKAVTPVHGGAGCCWSLTMMWSKQ